MRRAELIAVASRAAFCSATILCGCEREERNFEQTPFDPQTKVTPMSPLQPGSPGQPPPQKSPAEANSYSISQGQRLYKAYNCNGCHANGGGDIGPALMDSEWIYGDQPAQIFATIMEGRPNGMPAFYAHLTSDQAWQITAFVRSLAGAVDKNAAPGREDDLHKPQPPNSRDPQKP